MMYHVTNHSNPDDIDGRDDAVRVGKNLSLNRNNTVQISRDDDREVFWFEDGELVEYRCDVGRRR